MMEIDKSDPRTGGGGKGTIYPAQPGEVRNPKGRGKSLNRATVLRQAFEAWKKTLTPEQREAIGEGLLKAEDGTPIPVSPEQFVYAEQFKRLANAKTNAGVKHMIAEALKDDLFGKLTNKTQITDDEGNALSIGFTIVGGTGGPAAVPPIGARRDTLPPNAEVPEPPAE